MPRRSAAGPRSALAAAEQLTLPGDDRARPRTVHLQCRRGIGRFGPPLRSRDARAIVRGAHPATSRRVLSVRPTPLVAAAESWQKVSNLRFLGIGSAKLADYFHADQGSGSQFGDPGRAGYSIINQSSSMPFKSV